MLISTMNDVPGYRVSQVLGEVFGLTVRSRNIGSQFGAGLKSLVGGELKGMTKNLMASRQDVIDRMVEEAQAKGANAVLAMRFDTSEMGGNWTEICAYGTAVRVEGLADVASGAAWQGAQPTA
ncbi:MAG TPA: YbjQ family protein [Acidimicrobiales bacterium]|nr:YbjQ family protein [Acidimicrobiales bacterium]